MFKEFKTFIARGNVIDLAVGVIIGGAFGKIVSSLVNDIVNPLLALVLSQNHMANLKLILRPAQGENPELAMNYGLFLEAVLNFLIIALVIFLVVKSYNQLKQKIKLKQQEEEAQPAPAKLTLDQELLQDIRNLLREKGENA